MNGTVPHLVQYQGSKRKLANQILRYMPDKFVRLVEPSFICRTLEALCIESQGPRSGSRC